MTDSSHKTEPGPLAHGLARAADLASQVPVAPVAGVAGLGIVVFVALGIGQRTGYPEWSWANLDSEVSIATWFSSTLLWGAAVGWLLVAATARPGRPALWVWWPLLIWLALDEGNAFHERLERWSGVDWQLLYAPVLLLGATAWWGLMRRYRLERRPRALLLGGAAAWAISLVLELIQNWGGSPVRAAIYDPTMIAEEALEMIGSTAFLVAALVILRRVRPRRDPR